jgi:Phage portal protein, SPP1 Gp6-like
MPPNPVALRDSLIGTLAGRRTDIDRAYNYFRGDHPMPWAPREIKDAYLALMKMARSNWMRLIVQAPAERLREIGMRFSEDPLDGERTDTEVWRRLWQTNRMDLESRKVRNAALVARRGFVLVWPGRDGRPPSITPEHPAQMAVAYTAGSPHTRTAALKTFVDAGAGMQYAALWTDDAVYHWQRKAPASGRDSVLIVPAGFGQNTDDWQPWEDPALGIVPDAPNPMGVVSVVEYQAHPELVGEPMGELDGGVTDVQDRINRTVLDRLVTANFAAFPQKWVTGLEIPQDANGNDIEPFQSAVSRLWTAENPDAKFGTFAVADLRGYLDSVEADIQHLAATTRTPPHYLLGQSGAFPSVQSLKATETGLVAKVLEIRDSFTESDEEVIRLGLRADNDPRADDYALSMVWMNPESRSDAEKYDAATKMQAVGVSWRAIMTYLGYSPDEIERMDGERAEDTATAALAALPPALPAAVPALSPTNGRGAPGKALA